MRNFPRVPVARKTRPLSSHRMTRRQLLKSAMPAAMVLAGWPRHARAAGDHAELPPVRQITRGPKHHWFSYYDKLQVDPSGRYALGMEVDFEGRETRPEDVIKIGLVDLENHDRWTELGQSAAWGWQQGCMLQWIPGSNSEILWNDRGRDDYVCHILNAKSGHKRTLPHAIYCLSPDGKTAFLTDFRRIDYMRPGYGYPGLPDPCRNERAPKDSGIWRVDLQKGTRQLIVPLSEVMKFPLPNRPSWFPPGDPAKAWHYFHHLLVNPDGSRLVFLHRWYIDNPDRRYTRMFSCAPDGSGLRLVVDTGLASHFIWRDPAHILLWARHPSHGNRYYVFEDRPGGSVELVDSPLLVADGHCTYLPGNQWIVDDTYPQGRNRQQEVFLYHVPTGRKVTLGRFPSPPAYTGEWRVDTHPRHTPDGRSLIIDSAHTGEGRQMYLIDISRIVG